MPQNEEGFLSFEKHFRSDRKVIQSEIGPCSCLSVENEGILLSLLHVTFEYFGTPGGMGEEG